MKNHHLHDDGQWARVELYRWQHGHLPGSHGIELPLDEAKGLCGMAAAIERGDPKNFPTPFNVVAVLRYAASRMTPTSEIERPKIICLCGSGRFREAFEQAEFNETLAGKIVLTIGCNTHDVARSAELAHHKPTLDELHKRKIDLADEVLVLNVGGYIGDSTRSEIEYAEAHGKTVRYLEVLAA